MNQPLSLVQFSWSGIVPPSERSPVQFLVRAHSRVAGLAPSWGASKRQPIDFSLLHQCFSPFLLPFILPPPPSLKINK